MTAASNEVALLPCPFCGGQKLLLGPIRDGNAVCCSNLKCLGQVQAYHPNAREKAITAWNIRAHSDPRPVAVEIEAAAQLACEAFYGNDWQWGMLDEGFRQKWRDVVAASALATHSPAPMAIPDGYALVPLVPTPAQIAVGCENNPTQWTDDTDNGFAIDVANDVYVSMVRAAVHPSTQEGGK